MPDGVNSLVLDCLHELAEALHTTGLYLGAARRLSGQTPHADIIDKASSELGRAATAFRRLRDHLSAHDLGSVGQSRASEIADTPEERGESPRGAGLPWNIVLEGPSRSPAARYQRELMKLRLKEARLRSVLARQESLLRLKEEFIQLQEILSREATHRLWNDLQLVQSLLRLQSHKSANIETASQLAVAADRVATVGRIHRRLHSLDSAKTIAFKHYLEELSCDFSTMLSSEDRPEQVIVVEGIEIDLPCATAIPLAFIVNELITNAVKYGNGQITLSLEPNPGADYALSVCNDGPRLPEGFDPGAGKGLGMKIVRSFLERIGGELQSGRGDNDQGARFTVLFS